MENYYLELPNDYKLDKEIDAKSFKVGLIMNLLALVLMVIPAALLIWFRIKNITALMEEIEEGNVFPTLLFMILFFVAYIVYIVLHELTHGIAYKITTKQKLTFGFNLFVAFCGVPHIYISKKTALIALLAPFITYTIILLPLALFINNAYAALLFILLFSGHFGGCVGDLYCTILLLFKYDNTVILRDTGPKQSFYIKKN